MKFAYADPPYIGQAKKRYSHDPRCAEVDHAELIARLMVEFSDGWALSLSSPSLKQILPLAPNTARVMAWVEALCGLQTERQSGVCVGACDSPRWPYRGRGMPTVRDWHSANITLRKGLCGAKPESFCHWICDVLGAQPGDEMHDLYPGTGVMGRVWESRIMPIEFKPQPSGVRREGNGGKAMNALDSFEAIGWLVLTCWCICDLLGLRRKG